MFNGRENRRIDGRIQFLTNRINELEFKQQAQEIINIHQRACIKELKASLGYKASDVGYIPVLVKLHFQACKHHLKSGVQPGSCDCDHCSNFMSRDNKYGYIACKDLPNPTIEDY